MPASTEKKRNSGVRKVETTGLTPMAMPSGMAASSASAVPTSTRSRLAPMWPDERAVADALDGGLRRRGQGAGTGAG